METAPAPADTKEQGSIVKLLSRHEDGYDVYDVLILSADDPEIAVGFVKCIKAEDLGVCSGKMAMTLCLHAHSLYQPKTRFN